MVKTASTMKKIGTPAPDFKLMNVDGQIVGLHDFDNKPALLVIFMCNHCPFVKHVADGLAQLARDYMPRGVAIVGINSNDAAAYPADSPAKMKEEKQAVGYVFPYLYDETQQVARAYHAAWFDQDPFEPYVAMKRQSLSAVIERKYVSQQVHGIAKDDLKAMLDTAPLNLFYPLVYVCDRLKLGPDRLEKAGILAATTTPAAFDKFFRSEAARWTKVYKESGIKLD